MNIYTKRTGFSRKTVLSNLLILGATATILFLFGLQIQRAEAEPSLSTPAPNPAEQGLAKIQGNSVLAVSNPTEPEAGLTKTITMIITAYSSTPDQTDDTPFITASGQHVRDGIVANNLLPFGTKVQIPSLYGEKTFVVEDRMNAKKGKYMLDIWFSNTQQAVDFGAKTVDVQILKD